VFYRYYDALFASKDYTGEIQRALAQAGVRRSGARILEIGAGTGNHTVACARLGHHVVGVEIDPRMIALAQQKRQTLDPDLAERIRYFQGRVEDLPVEGFEVALALFNVVDYIGTLAELQSFLAAVARRLQPGAPFLFDTWNGVAALLDPPREKDSVVETRTHRIRVRVASRTEPMALRTTLHYVLEATDKASGQVETGTYDLPQTLWPAKVIADAAVGAGLEVRGIHPLDDPAAPGRPATERDWKILFVTAAPASRP
jgi:SAM-dependent methyltransferase